MRLGGQIALALVAIIGLVAGATYLSHYRLASSAPVATKVDPPGPVYELNFPRPIWEWETGTGGEFEMQTNAHEEYWFENPNPVEIELGVTSVSCKCSGLSFCILTEDQKKRYQRAANSAAAAEMAAGFNGLLGEIGQFGLEAGARKLLDLDMKWQEMKVDTNKGLIVPPNGGGLVRVSWKAKQGKVGDERLTIGLWSQAKIDKPSPRADTNLEITVRLVPVVRILPLPIAEALGETKDATIGDLYPREEKYKEFVCWSSVRAGFSLTAKETTNDPCFQCTCTPLSAEECNSLSAVAQSSNVPIRALSGYRIRVAVRERVNDQVQMDLGPFSRKIVLMSDPDIDDSLIKLTGVVRGDIRIGSETDNGRIVLGTIRSSAGKNKIVKIFSSQSGLALEVERVEPQDSFVKIKSLKEVNPGIGGSHWELTVDVPRGAPSGKIPEHTAVVLRVPGSPPRHIRIPIAGMVYQ